MSASWEPRFVEFVRDASPRLLHTAWLLCGDRDLAPELVQEALVRVHVAWRRIESRDPYAYTRRVLVNLTIDAGKARRREGLGRVRDVGEEGPLYGVVAPQEGEHVDLLRALARLTARERQVVVLRYYADLSEAQVADELRVSLGTLKSTASRALAKLRADLGGGPRPNHRPTDRKEARHGGA